KDFWNMVNNRQKVSANIVTDRMVTVENVNGNNVLVINVPRAERSARPVYVGLDPKSGTYRRNHDGDYHCSIDEVSLMFRDASAATQDAKVLENMDSSVFCKDSVRGYRNFFRSCHSNHLWNNEDDELFLRKIGAMTIGADGLYHPTAAGLLMFGYEYEITREFPNYFLDYQENRMLGATRWTDRIVSTSGDWSGNVFDFVIEALNRMQQGLKVPFVLNGNQRVDDTPIHKLLREAITNTVVHADFYGRQGIVIQKSEEGYKFSNPGCVRISISEAITGGISDPRNGIMLKMFSLIDFGERAGSGLCGISTVWNKVYHTPIMLEETHNNGVDRTALTLSTGGNEQDIKAMLDLYEGIVEIGDKGTNRKIGENRPENAKTDRKIGENRSENAKTDQKIGGNRPENAKTDQKTGENRPENAKTDQKTGENRPENAKTDQKKQILDLILENPSISRLEIAKRLALHDSTIKRRLENLVAEGCIKRIGSYKGGYWEVIKPIS
ncbi:MAG: winged helix-turn-helix transcriptional regulator, partial [Candidatus Limisoma sp.]